MRRQTRILTTSCFLLLVFASGAFAQKSSLDQVDAAIKRGDAQQARTLLERWKKNASPNVDRDTQARVTFLNAKLTSDGEDAEAEYLHVVISYPTSAYAAESIFRIAQARLAAGDTKQAKIYFKRVLTDFPKSEFASLAAKYSRN